MTPLRQIIRVRLLLSLGLVLGAASRADQFPDPHGDTPGTATAIAAGATVSGNIEIDIDRDWFSFVAERYTTYTIEVTPLGLWDACVAASTFHGEVPLGETNSVGATSAALVWTNTTYEMAVYVDVSGFAKFTTGTYGIVVAAQPFPDADGDGLTDAFESQYFLNNTGWPSGDFDGDGFNNLTEQWLGTHPKDADSGLFITSLLREGVSNEVTWISRSGLVYQLETAPDIFSAEWDVVATVLGAGPGTTLADPSAAADRFYRVRVKDEPDLHADVPAAAALIDTSARGAIDVEGDRDWFRFLADEDTSYMIRLIPDGGWDAQLEAWALGGGYPLGSEQGLAGATAEITWENTGSPQWVHLKVAGLTPVETGLYRLEVVATPLLDSEPDGLPDAWELTYFSDLSQGPGDDPDLDGFTNAEEKRLGTDPDDPDSGLIVTDIQPAHGSNTVTWIAAPLRRYEVHAATDTGAAWTPVGTATGLSTIARFTEPGPTTQRFYRVLFTP